MSFRIKLNADLIANSRNLAIKKLKNLLAHLDEPTEIKPSCYDTDITGSFQEIGSVLEYCLYENCPTTKRIKKFSKKYGIKDYKLVIDILQWMDDPKQVRIDYHNTYGKDILPNYCIIWENGEIESYDNKKEMTIDLEGALNEDKLSDIPFVRLKGIKKMVFAKSEQKICFEDNVFENYIIL